MQSGDLLNTNDTFSTGYMRKGRSRGNVANGVNTGYIGAVIFIHHYLALIHRNL